MKTRYSLLYIWLTLTIFLVSAGKTALASENVVRAILFYSPTCPHCHTVMNEDLPPLVEQYGEQLTLLVVDATTPQGSAMYRLTADHFQIPNEQRGVPLLAVGDEVLIGGYEIPQRFPDIIENGLAAEGIDWPEIPELRLALEAAGIIDPTAEEAGPENAGADPEPAEEAPASTNSGELSDDLQTAAQAATALSFTERFARDRAGNTLSVLVLTGMVLLVAGVARAVLQQNNHLRLWPVWAVPVLAMIGAGIAVYMGYVEVTETNAICGPVGDCNTVQQSAYASLFGIIPIGILGIIGYLLIGLVWLFTIFGSAAHRDQSTIVLWLLSLGGVLFSIYLTFLEPFIIGATCAWCLSSAVVMGLLLWATTPAALQTWFARGRYAVG